jgi:hypothetical protein
VQLIIVPASAAPYWVGTKNGLVVTWLTKTNFHFGWFGYFPLLLLAAELPANAPGAESNAGTESAAPPAAIRRMSVARSTPPGTCTVGSSNSTS